MFDALREACAAAIEEADAVSYAAGGELAEALDDLTRAANDVLNILMADEGEA